MAKERSSLLDEYMPDWKVLKDRQFYKDLQQQLTDAFWRGGVGGAAGAPVDMVTGLYNAAAMGGGVLGHKAGLLSADQLPTPIERPVGGSEWLGEKMQKAGMVSENRNPLAELLVGLLTPSAISKGGKAVYAMEQNARAPTPVADSYLGRQAGAILPKGPSKKGPTAMPEEPTAEPSKGGPAGPGATHATVIPPAPQPAPKATNTNLPDISLLDVNNAIRIARGEPHLIPSSTSAEGLYVGGQRNVKSYADLLEQRQAYDDFVAQDPRGGDWYNRQRDAIAEVTGVRPHDIPAGTLTQEQANLLARANPTRQNADWMSAMEGQWSAGSSPEAELAFALREGSGQIAGTPQLGHYGPQSEAFQRAIAANDWSLLQLGEKTDEYRRFSNPFQLRPPGATGVNDFRHAINMGYTEPSGIPQRAGLTRAQHTFADYETALAVDRANAANLGGRSDWTGEQLQAAPWVRQKAYAILKQQPKITQKYLDVGMSPEEAAPLAYEDAFAIANKTIGDFFDKHTMNITAESQPGSATVARGHMVKSKGAPEAERTAYALDTDPRAWAPGGRDPIYSGIQKGDTGVAMRVRPSIPMQGMWQPKDAPLELNRGWVHRPLAGFEVGPGGTKSMTEADRQIFRLGELTRAYFGAQDASAGHIFFPGGRVSDMNAVVIPTERMSNPAEMLGIKAISSKYGMPDVSDRGRGLTMFNPGGDKPNLKDKPFNSLLAELDAAGVQPTADIQRVHADTTYQTPADYRPPGVGYDQPGTNLWAKPGEGHLTRALLDEFAAVDPGLREAFNMNPYIPAEARSLHGRDVRWAPKWGDPSSDIQHARQIAGEGTGWLDRLASHFDPVTKKLKPGSNLPAWLFGTGLLGAGASPYLEEDRGE
jgi:hypothetical protein